MAKKDNDAGFLHNVMLDVVYRDGSKECILAPGQAVPLWTKGLIRSKTNNVKITVLDCLTYADRKPTGTDFCILSEAPGQACYLPMQECRLSSLPQSKALVGFGCGSCTYKVTPYGLVREKRRKVSTKMMLDLLLSSRLIGSKRTATSPVTGLAPTGTLLPSLMAVLDVNNALEELKNVAYQMWVPGKGVIDMVELPIPLLLSDYTDTVAKMGYTENDAALQTKIFRTAVEKFLSRWKIKEVYIGFPSEGDFPYTDPDDKLKSYSKEEYEAYDPVQSLRLVYAGQWHPDSKFSSLDSGPLERMFSIIREKRVEFPTL